MYPLPAALFSVVSFFAAPLLLARCRPQSKPFISPLNWFFVLFFIELVATPMVVWIYGPYVSILPTVQSTFAVNYALSLYALGYWSFCLSVHHFRRKERVIAAATSLRSDDTWYPPGWLVVLYFVLGVVGILAFFKTPARVVQYFLFPQLYLLNADGASGVTSLADAASIFLRVFFPFSFVLLWCRSLVQPHRSSSARALFLVVLIALSSPLYSYERSSLVIPILSIAAVISKRKSRAGLPALLGLFALLTALVALITSIRMAPEIPGISQQTTTTTEMYQTYAMAPQFFGFLVERTHFGREPQFGKVFVSSVLESWSIIGKPLRQTSGSAVFSEMTGRTDLPAPFAAELFLDFNFVGVIGGFIGVGFVVAKLQRGFDLAREPLHIYILQFSAVWFSYTVASSISVVSQTAFYLCWPIYAFLLLRMLKKKRSMRHAMLTFRSNRLDRHKNAAWEQA